MSKLILNCDQCGAVVEMYVSRFKKSVTHFCNKSCARSFANTISNPSWSRDLKGRNNPMYGKHPQAWNKGLRGESCFNWRGGIATRRDGYVRINIDGKRFLYHRFLLKDQLDKNNVVHHKDGNPSNNSLDNLIVISSQSDHAILHAKQRRTK